MNLNGFVNINAPQVEQLLSWNELIPTIQDGLGKYSKGAEGGIVQPQRTVLPIDKPTDPLGRGYFAVMPAYSATDQALACKIVSINEGNKKHGKPTHTATIMYYEPIFGDLLAVMDGEVITAMRTAAASAVASKFLVATSAEHRKLALLGAGVQARSHARALREVFNISSITVWSRTMDSATRCALDVGGRPCETAEEAVTDADIIVTATASKEPILLKAWVKPGAHINAVGSCRPDQHEIDPEIMRSAVVYVDSRASALKEAGDVISSGADIYAEIGEVVNGDKIAHREALTVFKSLGLGIEDVLSAKLVYDSYLRSLPTGSTSTPHDI